MTNKLSYPSYYRNHQYSHQFNMPDSAFQNRKMPEYISQLPQGQSPFPKSSKKHYQDGYKSVISQDKIINNQSEEESYSPAKQKQYLRNLNVTDIEGTNPNTIVSQAVRNRIKAKENILRLQKKKINDLQKYSYSIKDEDGEEQLQKMMKDESRRRIKTQINHVDYSYHYRRPKNHLSYKDQLKINQEELEYLKKKLNNTREKIQSYVNPGISSKVQEQKNKKKDFTFVKLQHIQIGDKRQKKDMNSVLTNVKEQESRYKMNIYPQKDSIIEYDHIGKNMKSLQKDNADLKNSNKHLRAEIRKLNPTYVSIDTFQNKLLFNLKNNNLAQK